jgi:hypothetical protein
MVTKNADNPIAPFKFVLFACAKWPFMRCGGGVKFENGFFTATSEEHIKKIEATDAFKAKQIIEIRERNKKPAPTIEESAELAAIEELKKLVPRAHRGAVGTRNLTG